MKSFDNNERLKVYKKDLTTSSGMWGLWDYETYKEVRDYEKWETLFCEDDDIKKQIEKKSFVPIYIFEDGCRSFTLKVDCVLSEREQKYVCVKSEKYLFYSNGKAVLSGIDAIDTDVSPEESIVIDLPKGFYEVSVFLLSWDEEPNAYLEDGSVNPNALSDFVVTLKSNADEKQTYRQRINTFSEDD
ncbi:MAG TPA: hypothetical protein H9886_02275 [Candidatus Faecalicoccus intestinipullorum]|nr:hypothetical protein [Candidatus Faecalicoccus intestinipullorum]